MSPLHNILVAFCGVFFLSTLVVFIGSGFDTRNQTWTTVFLLTLAIIFVPGIVMGLLSLIA